MKMVNSSQANPRIFVSHSHMDNDFGIKLVYDLRQILGQEDAVWYDGQGGLLGGETWWDKIVDQITSRNVFIVVLSPDAMDSAWVRRELNIAINEDKLIVPLLYRACNMRADLKSLQIISFLPPHTYEQSFNEITTALGLIGKKVDEGISDSPEAILVRRITSQIQFAFAEKDWLDVIRKTNLLIKRAPNNMSLEAYHMQGLALLEEGEIQYAREALDTALALVMSRAQRLKLLNEFTSVLASKNQWGEVARYAKEALRLVPNDPDWVAVKQHALTNLDQDDKVTNEEVQPSKSQSMPSLATRKRIEIFCSYAHKDEKLRNELAIRLKPLKRQGLITDWYDRNIDAGTNWVKEIDIHLNTAHIILLLISPDFLSSDYCYEIELKRALERHETGEACVIPIILRPSFWKGAPFGTLQALPSGGRPLTIWANRDRAYLDIIEGIQRVVEKMTLKIL